MNKEKLVKLLNLSSSKNDGEALSAIRKANEFIMEKDLNWEDIIIIQKRLKTNNTKIFMQNKSSDIDDIFLKMQKGIEKKYSSDLKDVEDRLDFATEVVKYLIIIVIILIILIIFV